MKELGEWTDRDYWLWLCSVPGLYRAQICALMHYFKGPRELFEAPERELDGFERPGQRWVRRLRPCRSPEWAREARRRMEKHQVRFVARGESGYPENLAQIADPPYGLFFRGCLPRDGVYSAAVVGARACTLYGKDMARRLGWQLGRAGIQVISGLALGIDGAAQAAAVDSGGKSYAILGCGADICYPREHIGLFTGLVKEGGVLSEFPCGTPPLPGHFPIRNRLISALADAVIVVEAREKSGSLITAALALDQGKEVYAVPGRSGDVLSGGCNSLIAGSGAALVLSPEKLTEELREHAERIGKSLTDPGERRASSGKEHRKGREDLAVLSPDEELVYGCLDLSPVGIDRLSERTRIGVGRVSAALTGLQLKDRAVQIGKNQYVRQ